MSFVPYLCCGDPNKDFTLKLAIKIAPYSDFIEIGVPFSDPIADGPTIQHASQRALLCGTTIRDALEIVKKLRENGVPNKIALMTYCNPIFAFGKSAFLKEAKRCGVNALIIPDLPFGEDMEFSNLCANEGIEIIGMVAQNTPKGRAKKIISSSSGAFTYLVSSKGTTGSRGSVSEQSIAFVKNMRNIAKGSKLFVGFGVSSAEHTKAYLNAGADGVIVGSEIINMYSSFILQNGEFNESAALEKLEVFCREISIAIKNSGVEGK